MIRKCRKKCANAYLSCLPFEVWGYNENMLEMKEKNMTSIFADFIYLLWAWNKKREKTSFHRSRCRHTAWVISFHMVCDDFSLILRWYCRYLDSIGENLLHFVYLLFAFTIRPLKVCIVFFILPAFFHI